MTKDPNWVMAHAFEDAYGSQVVPPNPPSLLTCIWAVPGGAPIVSITPVSLVKSEPWSIETLYSLPTAVSRVIVAMRMFEMSPAAFRSRAWTTFGPSPDGRVQALDGANVCHGLHDVPSFEKLIWLTTL